MAVLDKVQDPGNAGTIIRTADAAGCTGIVALEGTVDLFSDKTVRSAMGSLFHLPIQLYTLFNNSFLQILFEVHSHLGGSTFCSNLGHIMLNHQFY